MNEAKLDNLLELAVDTPEAVREKSEILSAGYEEKKKRWEVIVRYVGNVDELQESYDATVLLGGYAILKLREEQLQELAEDPRVMFIEKPRTMSFAVYDAKQASCITPVQQAPYGLSGQGVIVAVVDSGERVIILSS